MKMGCYFMRKQYGKPTTPMPVLALSGDVDCIPLAVQLRSIPMELLANSKSFTLGDEFHMEHPWTRVGATMFFQISVIGLPFAETRI
jgi:hypothetical protein